MEKLRPHLSNDFSQSRRTFYYVRFQKEFVHLIKVIAVY